MDSEVKYTDIGMVRPHSIDVHVFTVDGIDMVEERFSNLTRRLHNNLANEVFDGCTKEGIENSRVICDLRSLQEKIYQKGSVMVRLEETKRRF